MFEVLTLNDGLPTPGYYIQGPEGSLWCVFDDKLDARICVAIMNLGFNATPIEE